MDTFLLKAYWLGCFRILIWPLGVTDFAFSLNLWASPPVPRPFLVLGGYSLTELSSEWATALILALGLLILLRQTLSQAMLSSSPAQPSPTSRFIRFSDWFPLQFGGYFRVTAVGWPFDCKTGHLASIYSPIENHEVLKVQLNILPNVYSFVK